MLLSETSLKRNTNEDEGCGFLRHDKEWHSKPHDMRLKLVVVCQQVKSCPQFCTGSFIYVFPKKHTGRVQSRHKVCHALVGTGFNDGSRNMTDLRASWFNVSQRSANEK